MKKQAKSTLDAFSLLVEEVEAVIILVKEDAKEAIKNEAGNAVDLAYRQEALTGIAGRIRSLRDEFQKAMSSKPVAEKSPPVLPSAPPTKLVVLFDDGTPPLDNHNAAVTFAASLKKMGIGRVLSLNEKLGGAPLKLSGAPLVSEERVGGVGQKPIDGYWVTTQSSTPDKKKMLDKVAKLLGDRIVVKVVDK